VLSGRWPFASGCRHADWFFTGSFVFDGAAPRMTEHGPDWRLALFPRDQGEIIDNWDVMGMRATGSNDIAANDVQVPDELLIRPFFEPARHDGPIWRFSFFTLAGVSLVGVPLGIARRSLDELTSLAKTKVRAGTFAPIAEDGHAQVELARAEGRLRSARASVFEVLEDLWQTARRGDAPSVEQRATFHLATNEALRASVDAVDACFSLAGSSVVRPHPIQRCFRDIHTIAQHAYFSPAAMQRFAKVRLGIEQPTVFM
jgi:alkylation response protein AidB-like acyl-CoA dehydrogenase